jgi:hypothetical protein
MEPEAEEALARCHPPVTLVIEPVPNKPDEVKITADPAEPMANIVHGLKLCWSVDNRTKENVWVELANFKHEQFAEGKPGGKYIDPLHDHGSDDRAEKRERAKPGMNLTLIQAKVRKMNKYRGCYKYDVYVFKDDATETSLGSLDPRLEYDDGKTLEGDRDLCKGVKS